MLKKEAIMSQNKEDPWKDYDWTPHLEVWRKIQRGEIVPRATTPEEYAALIDQLRQKIAAKSE